MPPNPYLRLVPEQPLKRFVKTKMLGKSGFLTNCFAMTNGFERILFPFFHTILYRPEESLCVFIIVLPAPRFTSMALMTRPEKSIRILYQRYSEANDAGCHLMLIQKNEAVSKVVIANEVKQSGHRSIDNDQIASAVPASQ
jgi:hypothetical protein